MTFIEAIILGLVQGLTEFLPVSSSGHLVILQDLLGIKQAGITFEVLVHFGTLLSIFWVFWPDIISLGKAFKGDIEQQRFIWLIIVGSLPTGVMGLFFGSFFKSLFSSTITVGFMLIITGFLVWGIKMIPIGNIQIKNMPFRAALWIGFFQGLAIIPGISRSGSTIVAALWKQLGKGAAIRFSFILSIPAILGATILEVKELMEIGIQEFYLAPNLMGIIVAFLVGIIAIKTFIKLLEHQYFHYFSYYCWFMAIFVIIFKTVS